MHCKIDKAGFTVRYIFVADNIHGFKLKRNNLKYIHIILLCSDG